MPYCILANPVCCGSRFYGKITPRISETRVRNIKKAFNKIRFKDISFGNIGVGDRPQLILRGKLGNIQITYYTATPGGGEPVIYWKRAGKYYRQLYATQSRAGEIMETIKTSIIPTKSQKRAEARF